MIILCCLWLIFLFFHHILKSWFTVSRFKFSFLLHTDLTLKSWRNHSPCLGVLLWKPPHKFTLLLTFLIHVLLQCLLLGFPSVLSWSLWFLSCSILTGFSTGKLSQWCNAASPLWSDLYRHIKALLTQHHIYCLLPVGAEFSRPCLFCVCVSVSTWTESPVERLDLSITLRMVWSCIRAMYTTNFLHLRKHLVLKLVSWWIRATLKLSITTRMYSYMCCRSLDVKCLWRQVPIGR